MKATQQGNFPAWLLSLASAALLVLAVALVLGPNAVLRAQTAELQFVPANAIPQAGTFYSIQLSNVPPLPFDP
jgi:integral membrane sensor domain MASE1